MLVLGKEIVWTRDADSYKRTFICLLFDLKADSQACAVHIHPGSRKRPGEWVCTVETLRREAIFPKSWMTCEVLILSLYCGFRNTECRSLQWSDIDLDLGIVHTKGEVLIRGV